MTEAFDFIFSIIGQGITFLQNCSFNVYGYNANLLGIFLGLIIFGVSLSAFYQGGSY